MAETLTIAEYALGFVTIQGTAAESLSGVSEYALGFVTIQGTAAETLPLFTESAAGVVSLAGTAAEGLSCAEFSRGYLPIRGTTAEGLRFRERSSGALRGRSGESLSFSETARGFSPISGMAQGSIRFGEHCYGLVVEPTVDPLSDDTIAWCVNLATGGHSRYTGALDGSLANVIGTVVTAVNQLGSDRAKYVPDLYLHGRIDADLDVSAIIDEQTPRSYILREDGRQGMHRRRLKLARGLKGTNWQFRVSGTRFTLQTIEAPPVVSQRVR